MYFDRNFLLESSENCSEIISNWQRTHARGGKNWHESGEALGECNMNIVVFRKGDSRQQKIKWMSQLAWKKLYKKKRHTRTATKLKMTRKKIDIHLIPSKVCSVHEKLDHVSEEELKKEYKTNGEAKWNQHRERVLANRRYSPSHKKMENNIRKHIRSNVPSESWLFRFCIRLGFFFNGRHMRRYESEWRRWNQPTWRY